MYTGIKKCLIGADEIIKALETEKTLILATCAENKVTIRPMSHVNDGLTIFFQTGRDYLKMRQIRENPNVAIQVGSYQLEGIAAEEGHPLAPENAGFAALLKEKHPDAFARWSPLEEEVVVRVAITNVRQWRYVDGEPALAELSVIQ
jgi:succinate dehydrogenase/fumarate reductase flavoprotein subunit